jgi:citrate synthase
MSILHDIFAKQLDELRAQRDEILKTRGDRVISEVTVAQAFGGMREVRALVCDTSEVDPERGLIIRGMRVLELINRTPEEIFFLLLIGRLPDQKEATAVRDAIAHAARVPETAWRAIEALPKDSHPMTMLSAGVLALEHESVMARHVAEGAPKGEVWRATLDDALRMMHALPTVAAGVYRIRYHRGPRLAYDPVLDWAQNFCRMLGHHDEAFEKAMRIAAILQSDHEGGNVCAFTCHTVGSVLSNPYLAVSAGFNGLAGPLHGRSAQESTQWQLDAMMRYGGAPDDKEIENFTLETLKSGRVIPGHGHAVLRGADPRFTAMLDFGKKHFADDPLFVTVERMSRVVPDVLKKQGKAKNPYPNVDFGMGMVWHHFGITELEFYTVPFAISLAMGMLAQLVWNRALGTPINRPRSVTMDWIASQ